MSLRTSDSEWEDLEVLEGLVVPYKTFHREPLGFKTPNRKCFMPGRQINVKIIEVTQTDSSTHLLNPNIYVIQITHGEHTWTVKRRYKHFQALNQQLQLYKIALNVPLPTRTHRQRRLTYKDSLGDDKSGKSGALPSFPALPEALVSHDQLEERRLALEKYLQDLLKIRVYRDHHETLTFLEVSNLSFIHGLGYKMKEGPVAKRKGAGRTVYCGMRCFGGRGRGCGGGWQTRWLIAKESFVGYIRPKDGQLHCVLLFDNEFEISRATHEAGVQHGLILSNLNRQLIIKCWTKRKAREWLDYLKKLTTTEVAKNFIEDNRFASFFPIRSAVDAQWFVDGATYMSAVCDVLEMARDEIFICDWWLSPEIYMKRPIVEGDRWRLDKILQRKAREGVKVFVLLYKEVNLAMGINSFYSKQKLVEGHPENIKVLRHPDHVKAGVLLWAHHEKLVIVDQTYAFVGGIDLCYGRWDDNRHILTDLGSVQTQQKVGGAVHQNKLTSSNPVGGPSHGLIHLAKAANAVTMSSIGTIENLEAAADIPPESVTITNPAFEGDSTEDTAGEEVFAVESGDNNGHGKLEESDSVLTISKLVERERSKDVPLKGDTPPTGRRRATQLLRRVTGVSRVRRKRREAKVKGQLKSEMSRETNDSSTSESGGDNSEVEQAPEPETNNNAEPKTKTKSRRYLRTTKKKSKKTVKMQNRDSDISRSLEGLQGSSKLWIGKDYTNFIVKDFADVASPFTDLVDRTTTPRMPWHDIAVFVQGNAARDVARHFIQRWNAVKDEKMRKNAAYPFLIPKAYNFGNRPIPNAGLPKENFEKVRCQVIRSASLWSAGIQTVDNSIQQAYIDSIHNAKHYVYIENQFFISLAVPNSNVQNRIGEAILSRVLQAYREGTTFRVFVIIPLLPGFEGEVGTSRGQAIHAITHWNYASISRGNASIIGKLIEAGVEDPSQYVTFHGLRTWSELDGDLVTELIYVHSKLLIVDDNLVICGSANINDRSMLGKRDSEVAVILQDEVEVPSKMNGMDYRAGRFAQSLRMNLFREHLGLLGSPGVAVTDPVSDHFYNNVWLKTAQTNTTIFDEVFKCVPTDHCESYLQMKQYQETPSIAMTNPTKARTMLKDVKGYLVHLPLQFLCKENLQPTTGTKEALMPTQLWT